MDSMKDHLTQKEKKGTYRSLLFASICISILLGAGIVFILMSDAGASVFAEDAEVTSPGDRFNQYPDMDFNAVLEAQSGKIVILEYHIIESPSVTKDWVETGKLRKNKKTDRFFVTSEELREQLETLYERGFRNISLDEYLALEKGQKKTLDRLPPESRLYVITFDDATFGQFDVSGTNEKGEPVIDPDCAVGVMLEFAKLHPDFQLNAAFCVDFENPPFRQPQWITWKLNWLLDNGFEIVNHTFSHQKLAKLVHSDPEKAAREIGRAMELFESHLGYRVDTIDKICYPDGSSDEKVWNFVKKVTYNGREYRFLAALDAEGLGAKNPNDGRFNPYNIARIETSRYTFEPFVLNLAGLYRTPAQLTNRAGSDYELYHTPAEREKLGLIKVND